MVGKTISHYEILAPLGSGGMGEVYRARDTKLDRDVALKILPEAFARDPDRLARFKREAKLLAALNHPGIASIYGVGEDDERPFIAMELVTGETLAEHLENGRLPIETALRHGIEICNALHEAHRAGIVHRDLKPGNIMLTRKGTKLLDFGLAKVFGLGANAAEESAATAAEPLTELGTPIGTTPYMSPEQLVGEEVDQRTDIFAFGSVMFEMITGQRAFGGRNHAEIISAVMNAPPSPPGTIRSDCPAALDRTLGRCLARDPDDRWHSARDLAVQLEWVLESVRSSGHPVIEKQAFRGHPVAGRGASGGEPNAAPPAKRQPGPRGVYRIAYVESADGTKIAAARGGHGAPLLVVPTMADTIETAWEAYAAGFPERELITYDRRGTGLSDRGPETSTPDPYLQDAQAVVDGFDLQRFDVLGALLGSVEAACVAAQNPQRVERLVLRGPTMGLRDWASIPGVAAALATLEHDWEYFTESFGQFVAGWGSPAGPRLAARFRDVTTREELKSLLYGLMKLDLVDVYREIQAQTLIEHHPGYFFPDSYSRSVASMIRDCRMAIFRGDGGDFIADLSIARDFLAGSLETS